MSDLKNFDRMFRLDGKVALVTGGKHRVAHETAQTDEDVQDPEASVCIQQLPSSSQARRKSSSPRVRRPDRKASTRPSRS
jgi:hypothetical protein